MVTLATLAASEARIANAFVPKLVRCSFVPCAQLRARAVQPTRVSAALETSDRVCARVFLAACVTTLAAQHRGSENDRRSGGTDLQRCNRTVQVSPAPCYTSNHPSAVPQHNAPTSSSEGSRHVPRDRVTTHDLAITRPLHHAQRSPPAPTAPLARQLSVRSGAPAHISLRVLWLARLISSSTSPRTVASLVFWRCPLDRGAHRDPRHRRAHGGLKLQSW